MRRTSVNHSPSQGFRSISNRFPVFIFCPAGRPAIHFHRLAEQLGRLVFTFSQLSRGYHFLSGGAQHLCRGAPFLSAIYCTVWWIVPTDFPASPLAHYCRPTAVKFYRTLGFPSIRASGTGPDLQQHDGLGECPGLWSCRPGQPHLREYQMT